MGVGVERGTTALLSCNVDITMEVMTMSMGDIVNHFDMNAKTITACLSLCFCFSAVLHVRSSWQDANAAYGCSEPPGGLSWPRSSRPLMRHASLAHCFLNGRSNGTRLKCGGFPRGSPRTTCQHPLRTCAFFTGQIGDLPLSLLRQFDVGYLMEATMMPWQAFPRRFRFNT